MTKKDFAKKFHVGDYIVLSDGSSYDGFDPDGKKYLVVGVNPDCQKLAILYGKGSYRGTQIKRQFGGKDCFIAAELDNDAHYTITYDCGDENRWTVVSPTNLPQAVPQNVLKSDLEQFEKDKKFFFKDLLTPYVAPEGAGLKYL